MTKQVISQQLSFEIDTISDSIQQLGGIVLGPRRRLIDGNPTSLQMPGRDTEGNPTNPTGKRAIKTELMQLLVHTQEYFLTQLTRVLCIHHHPLHDMPDQLLMALQQLLEGAMSTREYRFH
jgi:hypothetical protein